MLTIAIKPEAACAACAGDDGYGSDPDEEPEPTCCGMCGPAPKVEFSHTSESIKHQFIPIVYLVNVRTDTYVRSASGGSWCFPHTTCMHS